MTRSNRLLMLLRGDYVTLKPCWTVPLCREKNNGMLLTSGQEVAKQTVARPGSTSFYEGAGSRIRTDDLLITNQLLYQLSYAGAFLGKLRLREAHTTLFRTERNLIISVRPTRVFGNADRSGADRTWDRAGEVQE